MATISTNHTCVTCSSLQTLDSKHKQNLCVTTVHQSFRENFKRIKVILDSNYLASFPNAYQNHKLQRIVFVLYSDN